jgi:serine/threonine-protein kinase
MSDKVAIEAAMLMKLNHPALVRAFYFFLSATPLEPTAIVMEDMSGGSLAAAIQKKSLTPTQMNLVIVSVMKGVYYLHANKILHRDLKPSNILFGSDGTPKIADFGSARAETDDVSQTEGGKTIFYSAPELNDGGMPSEASDVWAMALTVFEMLAGRSAFNTKLPVLRLLKAFDSDERPEVPAIAHPALAEVIRACWNKDPAKRMTMLQACEKGSEAS